DSWNFAPAFTAIAGARYEDWRAYNGIKFSVSPPPDVKQPELSGGFVSPQASLAWSPSKDWTFSASWGSAWRMPTVTELYQTVSVGSQLAVPNPNLAPEHANSYELAAAQRTDDGSLRVSVFHEDISNALISQLAPITPGSNT